MTIEAKPNEAKPANPREEWVEETDGIGQRWRVYNDGRRLKIGGTIGPGRPKKEVRDKALKGSDKSIDYWLKVLADDSYLPAEKLKASELLARFGLGTKDEVELIDAKRVIGEVVRSLVSAGIAPDMAESAVLGAVQSLGIE